MKIKKKTGLPYLFMLPSILILLGVYLLPFLYSLYISVTDWSGMGQKLNFVGLSNYKGLFEEPHFWETLRNNLIYFVELVGIQFIISMVLAVVLNAAFKGRNFFRALYFMPTIICTLAVGFIWNIMFDPINGPIKTLLKNAGFLELSRIMWLGNTKTAIHAVSFVSLWQWTGWSMVIYLAGLQSIDKNLYEAAEIDGANAVQKFFKVTLPLLAPSITVNLVNSTIGALKIFDLPFIMTGGGPGHATESLAMMMYTYSFGLNKMGYGTAISIILFVVILIISGVQTTVLRRREDNVL
ncbi:sugar ABC transporter permease [bacterium 1xD8-48]|jgi:raffinose/stachyose/melibiose transport system permease protein|nr:sugar ABC transporter permease [Lachnospiraceae bacterium]NBK00388.1 sugar ABC transporter permease [bacterium 1xD8-48]